VALHPSLGRRTPSTPYSSGFVRFDEVFYFAVLFGFLTRQSTMPSKYIDQLANSTKRPLQNTPFRPISVSGSNFNPQNTKCIPVVKIFALTWGAPYGQLDSCPILLSGQIALDLEQK